MVSSFKITEFLSWGKIPTQYSVSFIKKNLAVKVSEDIAKVTVCIAENEIDNNDSLKKLLIRYHHPKEVEFIVVSRKEFVEFIGTILENKTEKVSSLKKGSNFLNTVSEEENVVNIVNGIALSALRNNASDIHIHKDNNKVSVRFRVDGVLNTYQTYDVSLYDMIVSRIKVMSKINIAEKRLPQDGRMRLDFGEDTFDSRVSIIPSVSGEVVVMRLFESTKKKLELEDLGFNDNILETLRNAVNYKSGLILSTGPTGSGKTTTLHALLKKLPRDTLKIITLEDPVERLIDGIDQVQINEAIGLTFDNVLRKVLRQDPDVIMVGEIRDRETAVLALRAALTGHLVLSTLHTEDSVSSITRLEDLGVEPYIIASVLRLSIAERLVRKCINGVYEGRVAVAELLEVNDDIKKLISKGRSEEAVREYLKTHNFSTLSDDANDKIKKGIVLLEDVKREAIL